MDYKPSKSQLLGWAQDRVTLWVMDTLQNKFPKHPSYLPMKSMEEVNLKAGQQQILKAIRQICDYLPEDTTGED